MKPLLIAASCLLLWFVSCNSEDKKTEQPILPTDPVQVIPPAGDTINTVQPPVTADTVINISFNENRVQSARGKLQRKGPPITVNFEIAKAQTLIAAIIPDKSNCNIRFNQVLMPGNQTDGPFGLELKYKLRTKGKYQLIIGQNMMAGDPEACEFTLNLQLQ